MKYSTLTSIAILSMMSWSLAEDRFDFFEKFFQEIKINNGEITLKTKNMGARLVFCLDCETALDEHFKSVRTEYDSLYTLPQGFQKATFFLRDYFVELIKHPEGDGKYIVKERMELRSFGGVLKKRTSLIQIKSCEILTLETGDFEVIRD